MHSARSATIVGVSQIRRRAGLDGPCPPLEPARLMAMAIDAALADAGGSTGPDDADLLACVEPMAWGYHDLAATVASMAGCGSALPLTTAPGGNSPVELLEQVANRILAGEAEVALVTGAEALDSRRRAGREGLALDWTPFSGHRDFLKGQRPLTNELEARHGLVAPIHCYPLYENALRARAGRTIEEHQLWLAELMAAHAAVAATNPYAWFPTAWSPEEIATVGPDNRWVCFPYPKRMNAVIQVDQAAACVVMSGEEADRRGIPPARRVAILGGASATDAWTPTERPSLTSSPAYSAACAHALDRAAVEVAEVDLFDLYSCFPSAVEMAMEALSLDRHDPRPRTVTGGLAYAGGPGNNYSMHAVAAMVERLRQDVGAVGYVSALGMTATKHAVAVLSADPGRVAAATGGAETLSLPESLCRGPELVAEPEGPAAIETYTVVYDRHGSPTSVPIVARLADGRRTLAWGEPVAAMAAAVTTAEGVGRRGVLEAGTGGGPNRFCFEAGS